MLHKNTTNTFSNTVSHFSFLIDIKFNISSVTGISTEQIEVVDHFPPTLRILNVTKDSIGVYRCSIKVPIPEGWYLNYDEKKVDLSSANFLFKFSYTLYGITLILHLMKKFILN